VRLQHRGDAGRVVNERHRNVVQVNRFYPGMLGDHIDQIVAEVRAGLDCPMPLAEQESAMRASH